jgi:hypothetical protein
MARQWDGEMITTILIVLVAVVVLIVIIAVLALRYLRADDSDTFDDIPDEPRPRGGHDQPPVGTARRRQQREPVTQAWPADRPARSADSRGQQPSYRDRDTGPRPAMPERVGSQAGGPRRPAAAARSAGIARADDAESATNSWESLSDVDYWAELAADKPQVASAGSGPAARRATEMPTSEQRQPAGVPSAARGGNGQPSPLRRPPARPTGSQPGRGAESAQAVPPGFEAPGRRGGPRPGAAPRPAAPQRPATGPRSALPRRPQLPAAQLPPGNGHASMGGPTDDDPLTSPSFPAINAADSRSYRTRRSATSQPGIAGPNGYSSSSDRTSRPDGYPVQSPAAQSAGRHAGGPQAPSSAPPLPSPSGSRAANPYGSYLSTPPASPPPGYSDAAAASRPTADYTAAPQPAAGGSWHPASTIGTGGAAGPAATDGYLSSAGLGAAGPATGRHTHNNGSSPGYAGIDYGSLRYDDPPYPDADGSGFGGYAASGQPTRQYEQNGYGAADLGYSQDGYERNPGYGAGGR